MAKKGGWQEFSNNAASTHLKAQQRVQRTKAGKGGKLVTAITGLKLAEAELKTLLKQLRPAPAPAAPSKTA